MKKLLAMLLVIVMTVSLFAGCSNGNDASGEPVAQNEAPNADSSGKLGLPSRKQ